MAGGPPPHQYQRRTRPRDTAGTEIGAPTPTKETGAGQWPAPVLTLLSASVEAYGKSMDQSANPVFVPVPPVSQPGIERSEYVPAPCTHTSVVNVNSLPGAHVAVAEVRVHAVLHEALTPVLQVQPRATLPSTGTTRCCPASPNRRTPAGTASSSTRCTSRPCRRCPCRSGTRCSSSCASSRPLHPRTIHRSESSSVPGCTCTGTAPRTGSPRRPDTGASSPRPESACTRPASVACPADPGTTGTSPRNVNPNSSSSTSDCRNGMPRSPAASSPGMSVAQHRLRPLDRHRAQTHQVPQRTGRRPSNTSCSQKNAEMIAEPLNPLLMKPHVCRSMYSTCFSFSFWHT